MHNTLHGSKPHFNVNEDSFAPFSLARNER